MRIFLALLLFGVCCGLGSGAVAQNAAPFRPDAAQNQAIDLVTAHLQVIKTLQGKFVQASSNGNTAAGKFYMARPGRLRFVYDDAKAPQIIADGSHMIYYDPRLEQVTYLSIDRSPLAPILQEKVDLRDASIELRDVTQRKGKISIVMRKRDDPSGGEVTLVFNAEPLYFDRWIIRDAQDVITTVSLTDARLGGAVDNKLFVFNDPRPISRRTE